MIRLNQIITGVVVAVFAAGLAGCGGKADNYSGKSAGAPGGGGGGSSAPVVTLSSAASTVNYNSSTTVTWSSTNSTSCTSSGGGGSGTSGSFSTGNLVATTSFTVSCVNGSGVSSSKGVTITVNPSQITAFADAGGGYVTVTSANALSNGTVIQISGTTNYNGTFTVSSVSATTFRIVATYAGNDATGSWTLAGGMISGCNSSGDTSVISLSNVPSRFNGVAPLSVFFDASATTATTTSRPFHDLEYRWSFGDAAGSPVTGQNWGYGSKAGVNSRNQATGPVSAHVYESPGTYTVSLTVTNGPNVVSNSCAQIVVQDPDVVFSGTNTICVGAGSAPTAGAGGCPAGALTVSQSNFATAVGSYARTGKRVLFRRGDTYSSNGASVTYTGPGIIGAFGSGAKPIIQSSVTALQFSSGTTPNLKDWRLMDLEFAGQSSPPVGINMDGGIKQVTILRLDAHHYTDVIDFNYLVLDWYNNNGSPGHTVFDEITIADTYVHNILSGGMGGFVSSARFAFLGNHYDDATLGQHVLRTPYLNKAVLSNNTMGRAASGRHVLKMHGPLQGEIGVTNPLGNSYTEKVVLSDNLFINGSNNDWTVSIEPQNAGRDERLRDLVIERNYFDGTSSGQQVALLVSATEATIRNNIVDMTGALTHEGISVVQRGVEPAPSYVRVYNNTIYSGSAGDFMGIHIDPNATNVDVRNNLGSAPNASGPVLVYGTGAVSTPPSVFSNNLLNNTPSQLFSGTPPDFRLKVLPNPARDTGSASVPVFSDFLMCFTCRPQSGVTGQIDLGAIEGP